MHRRLPATILLSLTTLLVLAAPVLASAGHDGGEGWWGETNDQVITYAGFVLIIFFPLFIFFISLLQAKLDKRKYARMAAAKQRAQTPGGW